MTQGFYKKHEQILLYAPNSVEGPKCALFRQDKDSYEYPVDGWSWFDSEEEAKQHFDEPA